MNSLSSQTRSLNSRYTYTIFCTTVAIPLKMPTCSKVSCAMKSRAIAAKHREGERKAQRKLRAAQTGNATTIAPSLRNDIRVACGWNVVMAGIGFGPSTNPDAEARISVFRAALKTGIGVYNTPARSG